MDRIDRNVILPEEIDTASIRCGYEVGAGKCAWTKIKSSSAEVEVEVVVGFVGL